MEPDPVAQQSAEPIIPPSPPPEPVLPVKTNFIRCITQSKRNIFIAAGILMILVLAGFTLINKLSPNKKIITLVESYISGSCTDSGTPCAVSATEITKTEKIYAAGTVRINNVPNTWVTSISGSNKELVYWADQYPKCSDVIFFPLGILGGVLDTCVDGTKVVQRSTNMSLGDQDATYELSPGYSVSLHIPAGFVEDINKENGRIIDIRFRDKDNNQMGFGFEQSFTALGKNQKADLTVDQIDFTRDFDEYLTAIKCHSTEWFPLNQASLPKISGFKLYVTSCNDAGKKLMTEAIKTIKFSAGFRTLITQGLGPDIILFDNPSMQVTATTYGQAKTELVAKLKDFPISHASAVISKEKTPPIFVAYEIIGNTINKKDEYVSVPNDVKALPEYSILKDTALHQMIAEYVLSIIPNELLSQANYLFLSSDGTANTTAWVGKINKSDLALNIDVLDLAQYLNSNYKNYMEDLTHESAHLLQYKQVNSEIAENKCTTYYISDWGCAFDFSYMAEFYNKFWKNKYPQPTIPAKKANGTTNWSGWEQFYAKYPNQFVSVYAVSSPVEDFAESIREYIWDYQPGQKYPGVIGEKFAFFDSTQGLKRLRDTYHNQITATNPVPTENNRPTTLPKTWADTVIATYKIPIYPGATFNDATYYPECATSITEGSCENNRIVYHSKDNVKTVAQWYINHAKDNG